MDKIIADSYACIKGRGVHGAINKLRVKYYVRYMDDGVLILESKGKAKEILKEIEESL